MFSTEEEQNISNLCFVDDMVENAEWIGTILFEDKLEKNVEFFQRKVFKINK